MKYPINLSDNEKWQSVVSCDRSYDGLFFYGVKTTGIFCKPSCKSKTPLRDNIVYFDSAADAIEAGFRPCKRCCPHKVVFEPELDLIRRAQDIFCSDYSKTVDLGYISKQLGVSTNHLIKLFKKHFGVTPAQYIIRLRVDKAAELLRQKDMGILEVAHITGFISLSNFYKCFKEHTGYTPNKYRLSLSKEHS